MYLDYYHPGLTEAETAHMTSHVGEWIELPIVVQIISTSHS